jgi:hypothetical protein
MREPSSQPPPAQLQVRPNRASVPECLCRIAQLRVIATSTRRPVCFRRNNRVETNLRQIANSLQTCLTAGSSSSLHALQLVMEALLLLETRLRAGLPLAVAIAVLRSVRRLVFRRFFVPVGAFPCYLPLVVRDIASNTVDTRIAAAKHAEETAAAAAAAEAAEAAGGAASGEVSAAPPPPIDFYIYPDLVTYATDEALAKIDGGRCVGKAYISVNQEGCVPLDYSDAGRPRQCSPALPPPASGACAVRTAAP